MAEMMTVKQASERWNIFDSRITKLCREGKIPGAVKDGKSWLIPVDTPKPADNRYKKQPNKLKQEKLPLPVGVSEYRVASTQYYYIDKTMMIKDFLDERPMVSLFTRPRRFGKTLNMDMLKTFFEKSDEDTSVYFQDKAIWNCGERYRSYQGKYPVIFVSFKDIKFDSWDLTFEMLNTVIGTEFERHFELANSDKCSEMDKKQYRKIAEREADIVSLSGAFDVLSRMLYRHYGQKAIIIIDEYDIPIQQGHSKGFYDEVVDFMRNLFSGGLKDNPALAFGFLTYSAKDKMTELCEWYDGYRFGDTEIFNPWSVINYFKNGCKPRAFWQSTGSNEIISEVIACADESIYERLEKLLQGDKFRALIDTGVIYPQIKINPSSIYSFLLVAGYLKAENAEISSSGDFLCDISLPNISA